MLFSASGLYVLIALAAAAASYVIAHRKGLNAVGWGWAALLLVFPAVMLPFVRSRRPELEPQADLDERWQALAAYDPEIKAAVAQLTPLGQPAVDELRHTYAQVPDKRALPDIVADIERRWSAQASAGLIHVETRDGVAVLRDAVGRFHVGGRQTGDLATARLLASASARRARMSSLVGAFIVGAAVLATATAGAGPVRAQSGQVGMVPPSCETYQSARPRGGDFEQLSNLFGLSIYRWEEADFGRYRDFLLACERKLPSLRGDVPSGAWNGTVEQDVARLKEYAGYEQGRLRTRLDSDTPDYTPIIHKMSCDHITRASIENWAGKGTPGKIEGSPFSVPVEYWNDEVWQALENRFLECEQQRNPLRASRTIARLLIGGQRDRYYWEIDRAQEPNRNKRVIAGAQERQQKDTEELEKFRREEQARLAADPCNKVEVRRQMMDAANAMGERRYNRDKLLDLTNGRSLEGQPATTRSCIFVAEWSSGERGLVTITLRKNSFGDDLIEVRPF